MHWLLDHCKMSWCWWILILLFFRFIHCTEITMPALSIGSATFCLSILFVQGFLDRDE